jgi:hypothetical protein
MTRYIYEKYTADARYAQDSETLDSTYYAESHSGNSTFYFSETSGMYSMVGGTKTIENTGSVFWSDSVYSFTDGGETLIRYAFKDNLLHRFMRGSYVSRYVKGNYVETVTAGDGTYPDDGRHTDGYWYTKISIADAPTLLSPNGGETVNDNFTITWTHAAIGLSSQIALSIDGGKTWRTIVESVAVSAESVTYNFIDETESSLAKIRVRASDGTYHSDWDESDGVFTIQHNLPPSPPTNLSPSGVAVDNTLVQRLSWQHNDPNINDTQSKAVIEWKLQSASTWNVINVNSHLEYFDVSANVFPVGEITWRVKTHDQTGIASPYSDIAVFTTAEPTDAPVILSPSSVISVAKPNISWTVPEQIAYQIVIDNTLGETVWDTGEVNSTNKARTVGVTLLNGGQYVIKLRTKNNAGLWSNDAILNATVSYTPPPKPTLTVSSATGHIVLDFANPSPSGTQPNIGGNEVYKRINGEWVRVVEGVMYQYRDYAVASGKEYEYKVRAISADNETFTDSDSASNSVNFSGVWLHDITNPEQTVFNFKYDGGGRASNWEIESAIMRFKGRKRPVIETGEMEDYIVSFNLKLRTEDERTALETIAYSRNIVCYRDGRGRISFGVFTKLPLTDEVIGSYSTELELMRIDYKEGI